MKAATAAIFHPRWKNLERRMIAEALTESKGNRAEAARRLGIHRQLLHAKAEKYGLGKRKDAND